MSDQDRINTKWRKASDITQLVVSFFVFQLFVTFFQTKSLVTDLIPQSVVNVVFEPFAFQGLFVSFFLLISILFKIFNKFKIAFIIDVINLFVFTSLADWVYEAYIMERVSS